MTLADLMAAQAAFDARHRGRFQWGRPVASEDADELQHSVVCLVGEIGEFANILKKVNRGDRPYSDARADLSEELTDVFIYVMQIANQMSIDLEATYLKKLAINQQRFKSFAKD
jgi:NTP pyrophosphatase (non-canonical NTP hydrolase)